ncbi:hypothetical protein BS47DRAFT_1369509 [Hydnum rufescens UP504]|uniref:malate dehydrogenase n=1 Tax=Hydnum rufescens UP504 TaxID=1448309 RepID=A0A9P6AD04_9AGAM|nr:hypothetical protein BS47DRAFT_1369509 [Hydnum rufescens UP504]
MALPFTGHCLNQNQEMNTPNNNPQNKNTPNDNWLSTTHSLSLYDISRAPSIAADMSHVATAGEVNGYISEKLGNALQGTKIVIIAAGIPQKPNIVAGRFIQHQCTYHPGPCSGHQSMNFTVSIVTEVLKKASKFNLAKGVITPSFIKSPLYESESVMCFPSNESGRTHQDSPVGLAFC